MVVSQEEGGGSGLVVRVVVLFEAAVVAPGAEGAIAKLVIGASHAPLARVVLLLPLLSLELACEHSGVHAALVCQAVGLNEALLGVVVDT